METAENPDTDGDAGTRPAPDSVATMRPMSTQAVFRPQFDGDVDTIGS